MSPNQFRLDSYSRRLRRELSGDPHRRGFTLVELLVTVAIIIVSAIFINLLPRPSSGHRETTVRIAELAKVVPSDLAGATFGSGRNTAAVTLAQVETLQRAQDLCRDLKGILRNSSDAPGTLSALLREIAGNDDLIDATEVALLCEMLGLDCPIVDDPAISVAEVRRRTLDLFSLVTLEDLLLDPTVDLDSGVRFSLAGQIRDNSIGNNQQFVRYHRHVDHWFEKDQISFDGALQLHVAAWLVEY